MIRQSDIEARIARERRKLAELRSEILRREAFIQGLLEAIKILSTAANVQKASVEGPRSGSDVKKAYQLLCDTRRPLHVSDILKGIGKEDTKQNRASLSSSLARYARKGELFQREGPNEFSATNVGAGEEAYPEDDSHPQLPPLFGAVDN